MFKKTVINALFVVALGVMPTIAMAQWSETGVDVGPGVAGSTASADGMWTLVDTTSRVNGNGSMGQGLAIGAGPDGITFSHSIGVNGGGFGAGHNLNLTIGRDGTHVSNGSVISQGGNSRVIAGGGSGFYGGGGYGNGLSGGSSVTGYGNWTQGRTQSTTRPFQRLFRF